jgi:hypothetical protein
MENDRRGASGGISGTGRTLQTLSQQAKMSRRVRPGKVQCKTYRVDRNNLLVFIMP